MIPRDEKIYGTFLTRTLLTRGFIDRSFYHALIKRRASSQRPMTRKNAAAITVHSSQPPCNLWSEWRRGRARRPFRFRRKGRSLPARQIFQPRRLGASGSRGRRRRRKGLEGRRAQGGGRGRFEGVGVFSRRVVESVSGLEPNAGEDRTPRRNSVEGNTWSKTSLHAPWRLSTLDREVNFERIPEIQMEHNGATVFKSTWLEFVLSILSVDTHTSHVCPRIFDTLVQKSNANWIFASRRERQSERKEGRRDPRVISD